jgi:hypothetical protein
MLLLDAQLGLQIGDVTLNGVDDYGAEWSLLDFDGWAATKPTLNRMQKPRQSGAWAGDSFAGPRSVSASGIVATDSAEALRDAIDRLNRAIAISVTPLTVTEAGLDRWAPVQQSDDVIVKYTANPCVAEWSIQVASTDWRKFGQTMVGQTALPSTSGGLVVGGSGAAPSDGLYTPDQAQASANASGLSIQPSGSSGLYDVMNADGSPASTEYVNVLSLAGVFTIPFTIDATTVTGQVSLNNPGNEYGPVTLRVDGPCVGPVITHVSSGAQLVFSSSLVLGVGEFLLIDSEKRTALANGQASRAGYITSRGWPSFQPGQNTFSFTAAEYRAGSMLTVSGLPAWR